MASSTDSQVDGCHSCERLYNQTQAENRINELEEEVNKLQEKIDSSEKKIENVI